MRMNLLFNTSIKTYLPLLLLCCFSTTQAQHTFSKNYDWLGAAGNERGFNISDVGDGLILTSATFCYGLSSGCVRFYKLNYEGEVEWTFDLTDPIIEHSPQYTLDVFKLNETDYHALILAIEGDAKKTELIQFNAEGLVARRTISDTTQVEYITGFSKIPEGYMTWTTVEGAPKLMRKMDTEGNILFEKSHDEHSDQIALKNGNIVPLVDGGYLYTHAYGYINAGESIWGRRDAAGEIVWEYMNPPESRHGVERIMLTTEDKVVFSEYMHDPSITDWTGDYIMRCYDLDGTQLWQHVFTHWGILEIGQIIPAANGDIIGVGEMVRLEWQGDEEFDAFPAWMFRFNSDGELLWERFFLPELFIEEEYHFLDAVELDDGRIAATGMTIDTLEDGYITFDAWLVMVDENGCLSPGCEQEIVITSTQDMAMQEQTKQQLFSISPNPVKLTDPVLVQWLDQEGVSDKDELLLYSAQARPLARYKLTQAIDQPLYLDKQLSAGHYYMLLLKDGRIQQVETLIVVE